MATISLNWPAADNTVFASGAWNSQIGKVIRVDFGGVGESGRLLDAQVAEDGRSVRLTLEVEDDTALLSGRRTEMCPECGHEWTWHTRGGCMEVVVPGVGARLCRCRTYEPGPDGGVTWLRQGQSQA